MPREKYVFFPESKSQRNEFNKKMVEDRVDKLLRDFNLVDSDNPRFRARRFLESLIPKITLINEVDPEKHLIPYILEPNYNAFLVLERKSISSRIPHYEYTRRFSHLDYQYTKVLALGYKKNENGVEVGFFGKNENDRYLYDHPEREEFTSLDTRMLFSTTVPVEEIIPNLARAFASYERNKGRDLYNQVIFPSES